MVINKDSLMMYEQFNISIPESTLIKLEDGIRNNKEMLLTIAASHYGFRNRNWTVYRHDTVKHDIQSFVSPKPKPIIQQHRPKTSDVFGHIIAADYHLTDYYETIAKKYKVEDLTTDQYIALIKDVILPIQRQNPNFDGLAYLELVGKLTNRDGIKRVLDGEFLRVSIGAAPTNLICSECGANQVKKICKHFGTKNNDTFMLAESLNYKELSFVDKPADPFGRITYVHDGISDSMDFDYEDITATSAVIDAIPLRDFFEMTDKNIVCVDNICTIINREEENMKRTVSYSDEFGTAKVTTLLATKNSELTITDQDHSNIPDRSFAIVQKDAEGVKRRFPLTDEVNVHLAMGLLCDAEDLSPTELEKATSSIEKAAKKLGLDFELKLKDEEVAEVVADEVVADVTDQEVEVDEVTELCTKLVDHIKTYIADNVDEDGTLKDEDAKISPMSVLFSIMASFASEVRYAGNMLESSISSYLQQLGKEAVATSTKDALEQEAQSTKDSLTDLEEEIQLLSDQNMELNKQLRDHFVTEILTHKTALGILADGETSINTTYSKLGYESLKVILNDFRNMRIKISDSTVNNSLNITTINDPTQIADSVDGSDDTDLNSPQIIAPQKVTAQDAIDIINSLKARHGL
jgi:cell division protein FtsB